MAIYSRSTLQSFDNWWFWIRKNKRLLNLIKEQDDIDNIYLYTKNLSEPEYEFLIKKCEDVGTNHFDDPNAFIECSDRIDDIYQNIDD